ncbi:S41 family peptidase [Streptomyces luteogriseus]|uniref:S41 family peptidase n=1 Tax=Streptomyces luteogriseus TaxID=68233 RepID=UPI002E37F87A|nr:S41 family peptidase [Streptomyces luteogriseus]WTJ25593.1 S41 family peptidase [Streptomyces luteogriseus]WTJ33019.1 S41 family peptidase [Streptomyces luteogriseus]
MEENALRRDDVDWAQIRRTAFTDAGSARRPADTYPAIEAAVSSLGDGHSTFYNPKEVKERFGDKQVREPVEGRALPGRVGYLSLPGVTGSEKIYQQVVREGRDAVAKANRPNACGWVIDLRRNRGGNMWPMLAVVGPILGDGDVGSFVDADGKKTVWSIEKGSPRLDGKSTGWGASPPVGGGSAPVAVLTSRSTASSGEAVAVAFRGRPDTRSFGEDTTGVPTGNAQHRLSDGAILNLTEVMDADRTGRAYDSPIPPDEVVVDALGRGRSGKTVLGAATEWLSEQSGCT